jgi:hypothetical protein
VADEGDESGDVFRSELEADERVAWSGRPARGAWFSGGDFHLIPFSLLWCGFVVFFEVSAIRSYRDGGPFFPVIWGVPFIAVGLYMLLGRFVVKAWWKRHTYYAATNKRVLSLTTRPRRVLQSLRLSQIPVINKSIRQDGIGTLTFGYAPLWYAANRNTGLGFSYDTYPAGVFSFFDIPDAEEAYRLVNSLREGAEQASPPSPSS